MRLPELRMASYLTFEELPPRIREGLVPVRVDPIEPVIPLSYAGEMEICEVLTPSRPMLGEWAHLSLNYRAALEESGIETVAGELRAISGRHGGRALCLLDHDRPSRGEHGDKTPRVVFAVWWEEETGEEVSELLADGTTVHHTNLPKRTRPVEPKDWTADRRWRDAPDVPWPPTEEDLLPWIAAVHWQTARSKSNPHQYNVRDWGPAKPFLRVAQWIRETGETEVWGGDTFRYKRIGDHKFWTMGSTLAATVVLNRKEWGQDPGDREKVDRWPATPVESTLFEAEPDEKEDRRS